MKKIDKELTYMFQIIEEGENNNDGNDIFARI